MIFLNTKFLPLKKLLLTKFLKIKIQKNELLAGYFFPFC